MEPTRLAVLVGRSMEGDPEAFGELVTVMTPGLRQYCKTFFSSWHDAEDATQDAWIRAWQSLGSACANVPHSRHGSTGWREIFASIASANVPMTSKPWMMKC